MKVCAVIVAAWKAERWIEECLKSIHEQRPTTGWRYELRLGVDGCTETRAKVERLGYPYYWSPKNVGTYVMRNSLITLDSADAYAVFDADDRMSEDYLSTLLELLGDAIVGASRITVDEKDNRVQARTSFQGGVCIISKYAMDWLGGYRSDRMASDSDLIQRAIMLCISIRKTNKTTFKRRIHQSSLTRLFDMKSLERRSIQRNHERLRRAGQLHVIPEIVPLEYFRS